MRSGDDLSRLAHAFAHGGDREALLVLMDAALERGFDEYATGVTAPVVFWYERPSIPEMSHVSVRAHEVLRGLQSLVERPPTDPYWTTWVTQEWVVPRGALTGVLRRRFTVKGDVTVTRGYAAAAGGAPSRLWQVTFDTPRAGPIVVGLASNRPVRLIDPGGARRKKVR